MAHIVHLSQICYEKIHLHTGTASGTITLRVLAKEGVCISTFEKIEQRLKQHPTPSDISFDELSAFLQRNGFQLVTHNTHSYIFEYKDNGIVRRISCAFPHRSSASVKQEYIRQALRAINEVRMQLESLGSYDQEED